MYLPFLLLLPMTFRADLIGLPDTSPAETAISVTAFCFILSGMRGYRFSFMDILLVIYGIFFILSEIYSEAEVIYVNRVVMDVFMQMIFPYLLTKTFVGLGREEVRFSKRFVLLVFLIALTLPYEIRMMANPIKQLLSKIYVFPPENELVIRYGFKRFEGVYTHAILAGIIFACSLLLNTWLTKNKLWKRIYNPILTYYPYVISFFLFACVIFTFARAPLYSLILSLSLVYAGFTTDKFKSWIFAVVGSVVAASLIYQLVSPYFAENLTVTGGSEDWNTFTYRIELFNNYSPFIPIHPILGWGSSGYPEVRGYPSVDNYYLLLALENGL
ncbi:MAG: O-antigen ligase family protein, partial [Parachlamydiaceae bacterium]